MRAARARMKAAFMMRKKKVFMGKIDADPSVKKYTKPRQG
jgi:hypothetical protein